jgi:hypothetical protein
LRLAYVDSSCFLAIAFCEPGYQDVLLRLSKLDRLFASTFLETEVRAALAREGVEGSWRNLFSWVNWVFPDRRLTLELGRVLEVATPRGADLWHLTCALFLRSKIGDLGFLTLDGNQHSAAQKLGFRVR